MPERPPPTKLSLFLWPTELYASIRSILQRRELERHLQNSSRALAGSSQKPTPHSHRARVTSHFLINADLHEARPPTFILDCRLTQIKTSEQQSHTSAIKCFFPHSDHGDHLFFSWSLPTPLAYPSLWHMHSNVIFPSQLIQYSGLPSPRGYTPRPPVNA